MENIENIYNLIIKTKLEYIMADVVKDINIIDFAIISLDLKYKTNVYNNMVDKYIYDLDTMGYTKAVEIYFNSNYCDAQSEESIVRNNLILLRRWMIRCSGYMCVKQMAKENVVEGLDSYMKKYTLNEEVADINTLNCRLENIDEDILCSLRNSI